MVSRLRSDYITPAEYPPIPREFIQVRLLENIDLTIVGIDLRPYYLGKRGDKVELPAPNAMHLASKNMVAFCSN